MKRSGIYTITHIKSGRVYVGSSVDIDKRWREHRWQLRDGRHENPKLQAAWKKYGCDAFAFIVVEAVEPSLRLEREQSWLDRVFEEGNCFNIAREAGNPRGVCIRTPEWRARMSEIMKRRPPKPHSAETRAKMSATRRAKQFHHTEETKAKLAAAHRGNRYAVGVVRSAEYRAAKSIAMRGNKNGVGRVLTADGIERIRRARIAYWKAKKAAAT